MQWRVTINISLVYFESSLVSQVSYQIGVVVTCCLVHQVDTILVFDMQISIKFGVQIEKQLL